MTQPSRVFRRAGLALALAAAVATPLAPALAFCGFYVAQADARLFNKSSKVVLAWNAGQASVTMASDYEGDPREFALVVPVPTLVAERDIRVVDNRLVDKLDAYSAPRLTEYFDADPCGTIYLRGGSDRMTAVLAPAASAAGPAQEQGVSIEARYQIGVYDILILSARDSAGLAAWLTANQYRIPDGAEAVLGSYVRQGMHFFVAKVNLDRQQASGEGFLRPLQVSYASPKFMLPIRLGTVNAAGPQDLIVFLLSRNGRVETTNYRTTKLASGISVPLFAKAEFGRIYKAAFDRAVAEDGMTNVYEEYAWDMTAGMPCDPCAAPVPDAADLFALGARWHYPALANASADSLKAMRLPPARPDAYLTRLHLRYDAAHFPEDLGFVETRDRAPFQVVYKLQHPWLGESRCRAGDAYLRTLPARFEAEAQNVSRLTGWDVAAVRHQMQQNGQPFDVAPPGLSRRTLDRMFQ